jgi:hypothetical protein
MSWAKIKNRSEVFLQAYKHLGSMNQANMKVIVKKARCRPSAPEMDAKAAEEELPKKKRSAGFCLRIS